MRDLLKAGQRLSADSPGRGILRSQVRPRFFYVRQLAHQLIKFTISYFWVCCDVIEAVVPLQFSR